MSARFLIRRLAYGLVLMLGVVVLNFLLIRLAPGDPAVVIAGEMAAPPKKCWRAFARNTV